MQSSEAGRARERASGWCVRKPGGPASGPTWRGIEEGCQRPTGLGAVTTSPARHHALTTPLTTASSATHPRGCIPRRRGL
jgi:hypothetical protein